MLLATSLNVFFDTEMTVLPEEGMERCAQAGFEGIDFNYADYDRKMLSRMIGRLDAGTYARSLRTRADQLGLRFVQMHGPIFDHLSDPQKIQPQVALSHECLRWGAELGAPWVVFHPETAPGPFDQKHLEELRQRNVAFFRDLLTTAEKSGVGIAVENASDDAAARTGLRRRYCSTPAELIELVDTLRHPLIGICWDTGHAQIQRLEQKGALRSLGPRLKATHIQDNDGISDQHLLPYYGQIDWHSVIEGLDEINYAGAFCYEVHNAIRVLPDELRDEMLRYAVRLARYLFGFKPA